MPLLKCPKADKLFEFVSIKKDLRPWERLTVSLHARTCSQCQTQIDTLQNRLDQFFAPEPEITSSLLNVYSRLQTDETLILKGWKIGNPNGRERIEPSMALANGWLFRGSVLAAMAVIVFILIFHTQDQSPTPEPLALAVNNTNDRIPFAQIRLEDKNQVQVHYVQPELLQSVEFETTNVR